MDKAVFKKKWENYWYYYKWHTIAGVFVLLLAVVFIHDIATKEQYDTTVMFAHSEYVEDAEIAQLKSTLEQYIPDVDGNGEVNLLMTPIFMQGGEGGEPSDPEYAYAMQMKMVSELSVNPTLIVIFDDGFLRTFSEEGFLQDLSEPFAGDPLVERTMWRIASSEFGKSTFLEQYEKVFGRTVYAAVTNDSRTQNDKERAVHEQVAQGFYNMINGDKIAK